MSFSAAIDPRNAQLTSRTPTLEERFVDWLNSTFYGDDREGRERAESITNVVKMTPARIPFSAYNAGRSIGENDYVSAALNAVDATPGGMSKAIIIGVASPKFPMKSLREAEKLEAKGFSAAIQKSNTGVWKDVDGNWRHDLPLPDTEFKLKKPITDKPQRLADVIDSPLLFEADRDARGIRIYSEPAISFGGGYRSSSDEIAIAPQHVDTSIAWATNPNELMSSGRHIVAHEVGHGIEHHSGYLPTRITQSPTGSELIDQLAENIAPGASAFSSLPITGLDSSDAKTILKFDTKNPGFVDRYMYLSSLPEINARHGANTLGMDPRVVQAMPLPSLLAGVPDAVPLQGNYAGFARQLLKDIQRFNQTNSWDGTVYGGLEDQLLHGYR